MTSPVWYCAKRQLLLIVLIGAALWAGGLGVMAYSYALGGAVYLIPNLYFVHYAFRYSGADLAPLVVSSLAWGESGKLTLAALGFILIFQYVSPIHHGAVFTGFGVVMVSQWLVAARMVKLRDAQQSSQG